MDTCLVIISNMIYKINAQNKPKGLNKFHFGVKTISTALLATNADVHDVNVNKQVTTQQEL